MSTTGLVGQPLNASEKLNWVLVVELVLSGVLAVFFFNYVDRIFGTVVSYAVRAYTWRKYRAYIDVQGLQVSLLGGRIFFKDLRYHGHNVTVLIHSGFITWHYWFPRVRQAAIFDDGKTPRDTRIYGPSPKDRVKNSTDEESGDTQIRSHNLPCRVKLHVEGVQAFLYNRSPAYDNILDAIQRSTSEELEKMPTESSSGMSLSAQAKMGPIDAASQFAMRVLMRCRDWVAPSSNHASEKSKQTDAPEYTKPEIPSFLRVLPIQLVAKTGAVILGNENTKSIITIKFDIVNGSIDADHAGPLDLYKIMFSFDIKHPVISMRPNMDYKDMLLATAARLKTSPPNELRHSTVISKKFWHKLKAKFVFSSSASTRTASVADTHDARSPGWRELLPGENRWMGLSRYVDDNFFNEHEEWDGVEYARSSVIADCPRLGFVFYWDVPGQVPNQDYEADEKQGKAFDHVNGSTAPEYGMDLLIYGGNVSYGPWADRHRINFQNIFFPPIFADAISGERLKPGQTRISTEFKLYLCVEEETTLRIPVKEQSKDWKWRGRSQAMKPRPSAEQNKSKKQRNKSKRMPFWKSSDKATAGSNARPFAWLDLKIPQDSTVNYCADMIARPQGYRAAVTAEIPKLEIFTSVNHGLLWRSGCTRVDCNLSVPGSFKALRDWHFRVRNDDLELFILRDHLFLITDVVSDWASGPASDFYTFVPFRYHLDVEFSNFRLFLNANDSNIINDPANLEENHFMVLQGKHLGAKVFIPLDELNPRIKEVTYDVKGSHLSLHLCLNSRNTVATFLGNRRVAALDEVALSGSFAGHSESSTSLTDRLTFDIHGSRLTAWVFGFVIHHLVTLKENYFGEHLHFKTLEEYQAITSGRQVDTDQLAKIQGANRSNDLDIIMRISADNIHALLPTNIYKATDNVVLDVPFFGLDLRLTSYYLDMQLNSSPLSVSLELAKLDDTDSELQDAGTQIFVQSLEVNGHRAFGLPPTEPAYFSDWIISVGNISGECSKVFVEKLLRATLALSVSAADDENSLSLIELAPVHDITFVQVKTKDIGICVRLEQSALSLIAAPAEIEFNDWAGVDFSTRLHVSCPKVSVALIQPTTLNHDGIRADMTIAAQTHALLSTSLNLSMLQRKLHFNDERTKQQEYLIMHDSRTHRVPFLRTLEAIRENQLLSRDDPPAMAYPSVPDPLTLNSARQSSNTMSLRSLQAAGPAFKQADSLSLRSRSSRKSSTLSLSASIRSKSSRTPSRTPGRTRSKSQMVPDVDKNPLKEPTALAGRLWRLRSSLALSSSLSRPYFPLLGLIPDASSLPPLLVDETNAQPLHKSLNARRQSTTFEVSEDQSHTSIILDTGQGVQCFVAAGAMSAIMELVELVQPRDPDDLLDAMQLSIWSTIKDQENRMHGVGRVLEMRLDIPNIALRFTNPVGESELNELANDQFDIAFTKFALMGRHSTPGATSRTAESTSLYCTLGSLAVSVAEHVPQQSNKNVAMALRLDDLLTWLAVADSQTIQLSFAKLDVHAELTQIQWLTAMLDRLLQLGDRLTRQSTAIRHALRFRYASLAYLLTIENGGSAQADPVFISRPSYLLRAASGHVRNHDSWKIVSRFRHIFDIMPSQAKVRLCKDVSRNNATLPNDAETVVIEAWNQWRTWELSDVQDSSAMKYLFSTDETLPIPAASVAKRLQIGIRSGNIVLAFNPGKDQSDFVLSSLVIHTDIVPPTTEKSRRSFLLQVIADGMFFNINWSILPAIENAVEVLQGTRAVLTRQSQPAANGFDARKLKPSVPWTAQCVVVIKESALRIRTPHLQATCSNNGMNLSVVGYSFSAHSVAESLSLLVHAGEGRTDIMAVDKVVLIMKAQSPTIYASRTAPDRSSDSTEVDWNVAASSTHLSLDVPCEILDMIEVIDHFVSTEIADAVPRIQNLTKLTEDAQQEQEAAPTENNKLLPKLNLALLMDSYTVRVALIQAITYTVKGEQGRIAMVPRFITEVSLNINFDLDTHIHRLINTEGRDEHPISTFSLPLMSGQLGIRRKDNRSALSTRVIVERIELDASAVHALLITCKTPEVAKTFESIKADFQTLQDRVESVVPLTSKTIAPARNGHTELVYNISASLIGVHIVAQAPGKSPKSSIATLAFGLDSIQLSAYNCLHDDGPILGLPEVQASLRQFFVAMHIRDVNGTRPCGKICLSASIQCTRRNTRRGIVKRQYKLEVNATQIHLFAETAVTVVDVINHLQDRMKDIDLSRERRYLQRLRQPTRRPSFKISQSSNNVSAMTSSSFLDAGFAVSLKGIEVRWVVGKSVKPFDGHATNDLVLTIKIIDLRSKSRMASRLVIEEFLLQMVPVGQSTQVRSRNSALMPEVVFNVFYASTPEDRKVTLQAMCKSLNVRLESVFILLANVVQQSIILAVNSFRDASALWEMTPTSSGAQRKNPFGDKRLSAFLVDVDFAGAVVEVKDQRPEDRGKLAGRTGESHFGRFGQFSTDGETAGAIFRTPGIAMKGEYEDDGHESSFTAEFKISGSTNSLTPTVVPLIMDMSNSVKLIVEASDAILNNKPAEKQETTLAQSIFSDERLLSADPSALLGKTRFNLGIRICRQEFSLGCQPIARVDAAVILDDIYITANSLKTPENDLFFAVSGFVEGLQASVQHVYSRESTFSFNMERLALSIMNSKHVSGKAGISAVLKIYPMKTHINARQLQDFLLFRDIWLPKEIRQSSGPARPTSDPQDYLVQRYQQVAVATAFPWTASVSIESLEIDLDMGQAIGRSLLQITDLWASSKKNSNWEQNLCFGIGKVAIESTGRTSGFVELAAVQVRTSISWSADNDSIYQTPLIQASAGFDRLRAKTAFDYEAFGIIDIADFAFMMYNIREMGPKPRDRLVAILDGDKIQVCCTAQSAAQGYAVFQAVERLIQENETAYRASLKDIERYLKRKSVVALPRPTSASTELTAPPVLDAKKDDAPITLHTDVVVTLRAINLGTFPSSFSDNTVFLIEAKDIQGRFAVKMDDHRIHNGLGMTFGKVQVALTATPQPSAPKTLSEITVEDVVRTMMTARGGIILRVPKVIARMQTWQSPMSNHIDYTFHSSFEGKVDVGWNFSRIAFIRDMYNSHTQSLASRLGRALPESAVKITTAVDHDSEEDRSSSALRMRPTTPKAEKITAVVNVPQSKYDYSALEPPIIDTPQLRDMGEATPPLEWIGLHRDRLPNVTHQILIVGLLGVARNVEDAYEKILGGTDKK